MSNKYLDIAMEKIVENEVNKVLEDIKAELNEISEETISKADIDAIERCLKIIDKHISGKEQE